MMERTIYDTLDGWRVASEASIPRRVNELLELEQGHRDAAAKVGVIVPLTCVVWCRACRVVALTTQGPGWDPGWDPGRAVYCLGCDRPMRLESRHNTTESNEA